MKHLESLARAKVGGGEGWEICRWERVGEAYVIEGGVPKNSKNRWKGIPTQKAIITNTELNAEFARFEAETGYCGDCFGGGVVFESWSKESGLKLGECKRCNGMGKPIKEFI